MICAILNFQIPEVDSLFKRKQNRLFLQWEKGFKKHLIAFIELKDLPEITAQC